MGMTVESELKLASEMIPLLENMEVEFAVTIEKADSKKYYNVPFMNEKLAVLLPKEHKLSGCSEEGIYLEDLAGETFLIFNAVGFWHDIVQTRIPDVSFIIQNEYGTLGTLIETSSLPSFTTNITRSWRSFIHDRVTVPLNDECVNVTYYAVFRIEDRWKHEVLINTFENFYRKFEN